ncbi:MAG: AhpC/TSA family protein [Paludibacteraceae bacterium]|nr:AhpC/TSA family protein [Paludibacteraceae bacterium]
MKSIRRMVGSVLLLTLCACSDDGFTVKVSVESPQTSKESKMLYLENLGVGGISVTDSAVVTSSGRFFSLKGAKSDCPSFYRLRMADKTYPFILEPNISILNLSIKDSVAYSVANSEVNQRLLEYLSFENSINDSIKGELDRFGTEILQRDSLDARILSWVEAYKDSVKHIVYANPASPVSYFSLFRKLAFGIVPFNPADKKDLRLYSAVATAWHAKYKDSPREKQLYRFVTKARSEMRMEEYEQFFSNVATTNFPDLSFADAKGKIRSLSDLKGKYILLDFCVYSQLSPSDYLLFKNVYETYKKKGLEIYQVSYDPDTAYWKKAVADLPWVCVSDPNGYSVRTYNVSSLPYNYLIDKSGNIVAKNISLDKLDAWVK